MTTMRLSRSIVGEAEAEAVARVLIEDGYLGMGSEVKVFEQELAAFLGVDGDHVACVSSGTAALHLAVEAVVNPGEEVLVQSLTYIASFQAISAARAVPVACDIVPETFTVDLRDAAKRLTARTKAIMPVHYASNPGDLDGVYAFAGQHGLRVIEDAAHAFGCVYEGKKVGSFGDIRCFSFDGIKNITSGEGGALVTSDPGVLARVKDARLLAVEKDTERRFAGARSWDFDVKRQGYRYHMSNLFAAVGRVQLRRLPGEFGPKRIALAKRYRFRLEGLPGLRLLQADPGPIIPHIFPVCITAGRRDTLREFLEREGIETGIHYKPNHLLSYYGGGKTPLPVTERVWAEMLTLPLHPGLDVPDVDRVCDRVNLFLSERK